MIQDTRFLALAGLVAPCAPAFGQSFNLDVGGNGTYPLPSNAYGAAANQPGVWVSVGTTGQVPVAVNDINGNATGVTIQPQGGWGDFALGNNPTWSGDDERLIEDATDVGGLWQGAPGGSITWTITGLASGTYEIYTYAIAPDFPATYNTRVTVPGAVQGPQICNGAWSGSPHALGVSYALHTISITTGQTVTVITDDPGTVAQNLGTVNGFQIKQTALGAVGTPYCFGDGTAAACPCGNGSAPGANEGCLNSLGTGGKLVATGSASLANDTVTLFGTGMPNSSALYFQGTGQQSGGLGAVFGDGLRCAGGAIIRLGTKSNAAGASQYPAAGDPAVSVRGLITAAGTRTYQVWYRNAAAFCTASTFNLSNGLDVSWAP
jgi:hypothetical protein